MAETPSLRHPLSALLLAFLATGVAAQTLNINPGTTVQAGTDVKFEYDNPSLANQTIVVTVTGGTPSVTVNIPIPLDGSGKGTGNWTAPNGWRKGYVNAPGCPQQIILILSTPLPPPQ
jgi:hypothetical protein